VKTGPLNTVDTVFAGGWNSIFFYWTLDWIGRLTILRARRMTRRPMRYVFVCVFLKPVVLRCAVAAVLAQIVTAFLSGFTREEKRMNPLFERMIRAAKLDTSLYEEVEADRTTMGQAMAVVVISSVAAGIGNIGQMGVGGILLGTLAALLGWYVWAFLTYYIGTRWLPEPQTSADVGELLRTTGFSSSPGVIRILGIVPGIGGLLFLAAGVWQLVAMVIAVRQALDYRSTGRAIGVCLIGWVIQGIVLFLVVWLSGGLRPPAA
jgi:hypothetical protein